MTRTRTWTLALAGGALAAMALLGVAPSDAHPPAASPAPAAAVLAEGDGPDGEHVFMRKCKKCHGETGKGDTKMGRKYDTPDMTTKEWQDEHSVDEIIEVVTKGVEDTKMKPFEDKLTAEEIEAVAAFVKTLGG